jgi:hypothetical protein
MIGFEYYYLMGVDIDLREFGLGIIYQPKFKDFIDNKITIEEFYLPFLANELIMSSVEDKENVLKIKDGFGALSFFLKFSARKFENLENFKKALVMMYKNNDVVIKKDSICIGDVIINNDNFDMLCEIVIEMMKVDKTKIKANSNKRPMTKLEKELVRRRREYEKRIKKKEKGMTILDIANIVSNSYTFKYEDVLGMTIYQILNSYEILMIRESHEIEILYKISPKFEYKKDSKNEHWTQKIRLDKSTLNQND